MPSLMEPSCLHCPSYGSSFHAVIRRQEEWLASRRASGRIDQCSRTPIRSSILLISNKPHRVFQVPRKSSRATLHVYVIAGAHQALGTKAWRRPIRPTVRNPAQSQRKRPHGFPRGQRDLDADPVSLDRGQPNRLGVAASLVGADEAVQSHRWKTSAGVSRIEQTDFTPCRQARHQSNPQRDRIGRGDADGRDDGAIGDLRPTQSRRQVAAERARNVPMDANAHRPFVIRRLPRRQRRQRNGKSDGGGSVVEPRADQRNLLRRTQRADGTGHAGTHRLSGESTNDGDQQAAAQADPLCVWGARTGPTGHRITSQARPRGIAPHPITAGRGIAGPWRLGVCDVFIRGRPSGLVFFGAAPRPPFLGTAGCVSGAFVGPEPRGATTRASLGGLSA